MPRNDRLTLEVERHIAAAHRAAWRAWEASQRSVTHEGTQLDLEQVLEELRRIQESLLKR